MSIQENTIEYSNVDEAKKHFKDIKQHYETDEKVENQYIPKKVDSIVGSLKNIQRDLDSCGRASPLVYELLQNADDVNAKNIFIFLSENEESCEITFVHDGKPFNKNDISSICSIGNSSKKGQSGKIGYLGIGFKSVFLASKDVYVNSSYCKFKFAKNNNNRWKWMIIPEETYDEKSNNRYVKNTKNKVLEICKKRDIKNLDSPLTFFTLKNISKGKLENLRTVLEKGSSGRGSLKKRMLLFLNNLQNIFIYKYEDIINDSEFYRQLRKNEIEVENLDYEHKDLNDYLKRKKVISISDEENNSRNENENWLLTSSEINFSDDDYIKTLLKKVVELEGNKNYHQYKNQLEEEKLLHDKKVEDDNNQDEIKRISVGINFDKENINFHDVKGNLISAFYSGIDLKEIKHELNFFSKADFIINNSRDRIKNDSIWNKVISLSISDLLVKETKELKKFYEKYLIVKNSENKTFEDLNDEEKMSLDLLPQFLSIIIKNFTCNKKNDEKFFDKYIVRPYVNKIKDKEVLPTYIDGNYLFYKPKDTVFFWPKEGNLIKRGKKKLPHDEDFINDAKKLFTVKDFKLLKKLFNSKDDFYNYENFIKGFSKEKGSDSTAYNDESLFTYKVKNSAFVLPFFTSVYQGVEHNQKGFYSEIKEETKDISRKINGLQNISNQILNDKFDLIVLNCLKDFVYSKLENIRKCEEEKLINEFLIKYYSYLSNFDFTIEITDDKKVSLKPCFNIFIKEDLKSIVTSGECPFNDKSLFEDNKCPLKESCISYNKPIRLYNHPGDNKKIYSDLDIKNLNFLHEGPNSYDKFKTSYRGTSQGSDKCKKANLGNYFKNYMDFLKEFNVKTVPSKKLLEGIINEYDGNDDIDLELNKKHLLLLVKVFKEDRGDILSKNTNNTLIKLQSKNGELKNPEDLMYTSKWHSRYDFNNKLDEKMLDTDIEKQLYCSKMADLYEKNLELDKDTKDILTDKLPDLLDECYLSLQDVDIQSLTELLSVIGVGKEL